MVIPENSGKIFASAAKFQFQAFVIEPSRLPDPNNPTKIRHFRRKIVRQGVSKTSQVFMTARRKLDLVADEINLVVRK